MQKYQQHSCLGKETTKWVTVTYLQYIITKITDTIKHIDKTQGCSSTKQTLDLDASLQLMLTSVSSGHQLLEVEADDQQVFVPVNNLHFC